VSLVVSATGTEVGKTVVSAVLLARYPACAYWKPFASGAADGSDTETVRRLAPAGSELLPEAYSLQAPLSPHLAARLEGRSIDSAPLLEPARRQRLVIEGIGGLMVPLRDDGELFLDWLAALERPCLLVARSELGTINHTLLSLAALSARRVEIAGVVLNGPPNPDNRDAIERFGQTAVIAELAPLVPLDRDAIARAAEHFDREGRLERFL
jgi:dethiobiotin synthase